MLRGSASDDNLDYLMQSERRKYQRFSSTAFLGTPLHLTPVPPFFGSPIDGQVIDLSGGGMAVLIREAIPSKTKLFMELKFPSGAVLACHVAICRTAKSAGGFLTGIQFLDMPDAMAGQIDRMAQDYNDCDGRIAANAPEICRADCSFLSICEKPQKRAFLRNADNALHMKLKTVDPPEKS